MGFDESSIVIAYAEMSVGQWGAVIGASLAAAICDLRTGRIPNVLTLTLAGAGIIYAAWRAGLPGAGEALLAWVIVALPYIILFLLGRGGAGDAKMMGAIGTWVGLKAGLIVLCSVAVAGMVFALLRIAVSKDHTIISRNLVASLYVYLIACASGGRGYSLLTTTPQEQANQENSSVTVPYGVAIFLGVCLGAATVHLWTK